MNPIFTIYAALRGLGVIDEKCRLKKSDDDAGDWFTRGTFVWIIGILAVGDLILYFGSRH